MKTTNKKSELIEQYGINGKRKNGETSFSEDILHINANNDYKLYQYIQRNKKRLANMSKEQQISAIKSNMTYKKDASKIKSNYVRSSWLKNLIKGVDADD